MLTRLYVEALLADAVLADEIWALWDAGLISDDLAAWAFLDGQIDGETQALAFAWLEGNHERYH